VFRQPESLDSRVAIFRDVDLPGGLRDRDPTRCEELSRPFAHHAELALERAVRGEDGNPMVRAVTHVNLSVRGIDRNAPREIELIVRGAHGPPLTQERARRAEPHDAIHLPVRHIHLPGRGIQRNKRRLLELAGTVSGGAEGVERAIGGNPGKRPGKGKNGEKKPQSFMRLKTSSQTIRSVHPFLIESSREFPPTQS
jgi:hypothetical protein